MKHLSPPPSPTKGRGRWEDPLPPVGGEGGIFFPVVGAARSCSHTGS